MEKDQIKIKFDANGNVKREIIEEVPQQERPKLLKKIATAFNFSAV